ncbi:hypothetical protein B2G71_20280 [Novosphingobium sp. PC22D]|uniref:hypothetical protein n=1 Tax=Novosphingobium sp. PC22D TaxID=1962403 RepID=UPI000BEF2F26|nr:hypothetical protein [Novosphingobium sp. PC22D]PEQ10807.1 hypothetical protein B2G71_20280 [Novosphingobium sp. PC22D]
MLAEVTIGELGEREFLREIEMLLRDDEVDRALSHLAGLLAPYCGADGPLPASFLEARASDVTIEGWSSLKDRMRELDRDSYPITAIGIEIADPAAIGMSPDEQGRLDPFVETCFYTDSAFPFSECDRDALMEGYSSYGAEWQGSADACDETLAVRGIHALYGAVVDLGARVADPAIPTSEADAQAYAIGAAYVAALIHAGVRETIRREDMCRPLAVFVAGVDSYPGFDAPVATALDIVTASVPPVADVAPPPTPTSADSADWADSADIDAIEAELPPPAEPDLPPPTEPLDPDAKIAPAGPDREPAVDSDETGGAEPPLPAAESGEIAKAPAETAPDQALPEGFLQLSDSDEAADDDDEEDEDEYGFAAQPEEIDFGAIDWGDPPPQSHAAETGRPADDFENSEQDQASSAQYTSWQDELRELRQDDAPASDEPAELIEDGEDSEDDLAWHLPPPGIHVTGKQLRHKLVTAESIAQTQDVEKESLIQRLFGRFLTRS